MFLSMPIAPFVTANDVIHAVKIGKRHTSITLYNVVNRESGGITTHHVCKRVYFSAANIFT